MEENREAASAGDRKRRRTRCVAFDAVGTLIEPHPPVALAYQSVATRFGSRYTADDLRSRFRAAFATEERIDLESASALSRRADGLATSEARERERWRFIVGNVIDDASDPERCFLDLWEHFARPSAWRCYPDVAETIARLEAAGLALAVASNFDSRLHGVCAGLPPLDRIGLRVVSSEVGSRKPSRRFFEALEHASGFRPDEIVVVGDDLENDVRGAAEAGMQPVWLRRGAASLDDEALPSGTRVVADLRQAAALVE